MKKKWSLFIVCVLGISVLFFFVIHRFIREAPSRTAEHTKRSYGAYFVSVAVSKFTQTDLPCLCVQIDNKTFSMELDLGFQGDLTIESSFINQISSKTLIDIKDMYGFRGKAYPTNLYLIPKIEIGAMSFIQPILQENSEEFRQDGEIVQLGNNSSSHEPGRVGWELFHNVNLLLDLKNSKIAFCDSLETLKKQGYSFDNFVKIPLLIERGLVEFEAQPTKKTALRCMLDTGCTWNILNTEIEPDKSIEQVAWEHESITEYPSFQIGNRDFGAVAFHLLPIKIPIRIDAILGMEFFKEHLVFLDFSEKCIYFSKNHLFRDEDRSCLE